MTSPLTRDQELYAILTEYMPGDVATLILGYKNESWALQRAVASAAISSGADWKRYVARQPAYGCYFNLLSTVTYGDQLPPYNRREFTDLIRRMWSRYLLALGDLGLVRPADLNKHPPMQCGICVCSLCLSAAHHHLTATGCVASDRFPSDKPCKRRLIIAS